MGARDPQRQGPAGITAACEGYEAASARGLGEPRRVVRTVGAQLLLPIWQGFYASRGKAPFGAGFPLPAPGAILRRCDAWER